jgi:hypothetical protein
MSIFIFLGPAFAPATRDSFSLSVSLFGRSIGAIKGKPLMMH